MVKLHHPSSILDGRSSLHKLHHAKFQDFISHNSFIKYWRLCDEYGFITKVGKDKQMIDLDKISDQLELFQGHFESKEEEFTVHYRHRKLFNRKNNIRTLTFLNMEKFVIGAEILFKNKYQFKKVDFNLAFISAYRSKNKCKNDLKVFKQGMKLAKELMLDVDELYQRILGSNNRVVTGSISLSKYLNISISKANRTLQKGKKLGLFTRKVAFTDLGKYSDEKWDFLRNEKVPIRMAKFSKRKDIPKNHILKVEGSELYLNSDLHDIFGITQKYKKFGSGKGCMSVYSRGIKGSIIKNYSPLRNTK